MLILYFIIPFLIFSLYGFVYLGWSKKNKNHLSFKQSKKIKALHFITLFVCTVMLFIEIKFNYRLNYIWLKRILITFLFFSGILFNAISYKILFNKFEKKYFKLFSYLPILISIIWLIPFWGIFICYSVFCTLFNPVKMIYYEDSNLKIVSSYFNPMASAKIEMYRKGLFFNKTIKMKEDRIYYIDSIKVQCKNDKTKILFYNNENSENPIIEEFKN